MINNGVGCGGYVVLGIMLFLYPFVLDGCKNGWAWDNGFTLGLKLKQCIYVDVFYFPGEYIGGGGQLSDACIRGEASSDKLVCKRFCRAIGGGF